MSQARSSNSKLNQNYGTVAHLCIIQIIFPIFEPLGLTFLSKIFGDAVFEPIYPPRQQCRVRLLQILLASFSVYFSCKVYLFKRHFSRSHTSLALKQSTEWYLDSSHAPLPGWAVLSATITVIMCEARSTWPCLRITGSIRMSIAGCCSA